MCAEPVGSGVGGPQAGLERPTKLEDTAERKLDEIKDEEAKLVEEELWEKDDDDDDELEKGEPEEGMLRADELNEGGSEADAVKVDYLGEGKPKENGPNRLSGRGAL